MVFAGGFGKVFAKSDGKTPVPGQLESRADGNGFGEAAVFPADQDFTVPADDPASADTASSGTVAKPPVPDAATLADAKRSAQLIAAVQQRQGALATRLAQMHDRAIQFQFSLNKQLNSRKRLAAAVLTEAELTRQDRLLDAAYALLQALRTRYPTTPTAELARAEIAVLVGHWRTLSKWERSAKLATRFLADNKDDRELPKIRQEIARDYLAWAAQGVEKNGSKQKMLDTVNERFARARSELASIVADFTADARLRPQ
ncbi:MAG: hypothetical protein IIC06_08490, partial [Proteobacteria bacterium]|nr:hypothetical protein [Pseudomonadota bacterium]